MTLVSQFRTILFADVSGSTALYETLGDKTAAKAIESCLNRLQGIVEQNGGRVVKRIGDEVMVVFLNAEQAFQASRSMQLGVSNSAPVQGVSLAIRVGFHHGPVLEEKGDFWGDSVNTASRLAGLAKAGQIYTSGTTVCALPAHLRGELRDLSELAVKGKQDALQVFELMWEDTGDATLLVGVTTGASQRASLRLRVGTTELELPPDCNALILGRERNCDLVIDERTASRRHARIERRGMQFFLIDESTNGTYLRVEDDREILLRREQAPLRRRGVISFGTPGARASQVIEYEAD